MLRACRRPLFPAPSSSVLSAEFLSAAEALRPGGMFPTHGACLEVLNAMEGARPPWWDPPCSAFVDSVRRVSVPAPAEAPHPVIVVEGLDGAGKTTLTKALASRLGGDVVCTPDPALAAVRAKFRGLPEVLSRAFYGGVNYLAAEAVALRALQSPVVVDRWYGSTASMAIAMHADPLPPAGAAVYEWPRDLRPFALGVLLDVPEEVRLRRLKLRGDESGEEALLRQSQLRDRVRETFRRMGYYRVVCAPTYMHMTNEILAIMAEGGLLTRDPAGLMFSDAEVAACRPY